jgi:hypothetical protein
VPHAFDAASAAPLGLAARTDDVFASRGRSEREGGAERALARLRIIPQILPRRPALAATHQHERRTRVDTLTPLSLAELRALQESTEKRIRELESPTKELEALYLRRMQLGKAVAVAARGERTDRDEP